jgi:hypothetical protein
LRRRALRGPTGRLRSTGSSSAIATRLNGTTPTKTQRQPACCATAPAIKGPTRDGITNVDPIADCTLGTASAENTCPITT